MSARAGHKLVFAVVAWSYRWTRYTVKTWHINTLICELFIALREWSVVKFAFCFVQVARRFASTGARSWCSTNLASDATRPPSCLGQRVKQFKLDRPCHVSTRVREQSRDNYVICLSLWHVGTWNELTRRDALLEVWNEKKCTKINTKIWPCVNTENTSFCELVTSWVAWCGKDTLITLLVKFGFRSVEKWIVEKYLPS